MALFASVTSYTCFTIQIIARLSSSGSPAHRSEIRIRSGAFPSTEDIPEPCLRFLHCLPGSETVVIDGHWHRIGLVWDGSYRSLYVDDELVATDVAPQNNFPSSQGGLYIGAASDRHSGTFWSGLIDDVESIIGW